MSILIYIYTIRFTEKFTNIILLYMEALINKYKYEILNDEKDYVKYEQELYNAFTVYNSTNWLVKNYHIIDGCRFRAKVPYVDQILYITKFEDQLLFGASIHINLKNRGYQQLKDIGFNINVNDCSCEALNFFISDKFDMKKNLSIHEYIKFTKFAFNDLRQRGYKVMYGTCDEKLLNFYKVFGFKCIKKKDIFNKVKHLLEIKF